MAAALEGIRIVDLTQCWAGPYATQLLADHGAEVIKVESVQRVDPFRATAAQGLKAERGWERASLFLSFNFSKQDITLDLSKPEGIHLFKRLLVVSDVVIENFSAGTMERMGLSYPVLRKVKPDIVMVSMPAYGSGGPYASYRAMGTNMEAMSGLSWLAGYANGAPSKAGLGYGDPIGGLFAAFAILAALHHRKETGKGQWIEISGTEALTCLVPEAILDCAMNDRLAERRGNDHDSMVPHGCYRCRGDDRWVAIAVANDDEWNRLCVAMGDPVWAHSDEFSNTMSRHRFRRQLDAQLEAWTRESDAEQVELVLQAAGVSASVVADSKDLVENEQFRAREFIRDFDHPVAGKRIYRDVPWKMSGTPRARRRQPLLGEHNNEVLQGLLGMDDAEMGRLANLQIIGTEPI